MASEAKKNGAKPASMPTGLGRRGSSFWRRVTREYVLRPDELAVLEHACRTVELVALLEAAIKTDGTMVTGSTGQIIVNPAFIEVRQQRQLLSQLLARIGLTDTGLPATGKVGTGDVSAKARAAANARWEQHRGLKVV